MIAQPRSGLLQAAVVTLYTTFLLYSAVSNEPYGPDRSEIYELLWLVMAGVFTDCNLSHSERNAFSEGRNEVAVGVIGIVLIFISTTYLT